jgi:hypothetical protein
MRRRLPSLRRLPWVMAALLCCLSSQASSARAEVETPHPAASFIESIGVVTHAAAWASAYGNIPELEARLEELGVRHIRDAAIPGHPWEYAIFRNLAAHGIKATLILNEEDLTKDHRIIESELSGAVDAVEGPNEYDNQGIPNWAERLRLLQSEVWDSYREEGQLENLPILGPALTRPNSLEELGNISAHYDFGNFHPYPGGLPPETNISREINRILPYAGGKPLVASETGYDNALAAPPGGNSPISEEASAVYVPRIFLDYYKMGVARTFLYELVDEKPDPSDANEQDHFGLLRNDWSPKPAFIALRNLIALLKDQPQATQEVKPTDLSLSGETSDVEHLLLEKADGVHELVLWQNASVWSREKRIPLAVPPHRVSISAEGDIADATIAQPLVSTERLPIEAEGGRLNVEVTAAPIVIEIPPSTEQPSTAPSSPNVSNEAPPVSSSEPPASSSEPPASSSEPPVSAPVKDPTGSESYAPEPRKTSPHGAGSGSVNGLMPAGGEVTPLGNPARLGITALQPELALAPSTVTSSETLRFLRAVRRSVARALRHRCHDCGSVKVTIPDTHAGVIKIELYMTKSPGRAASIGRRRKAGHVKLYVGRGSATLTNTLPTDIVLHLTNRGSKALLSRAARGVLAHITFEPQGQAPKSKVYRIKHS